MTVLRLLILCAGLMLCTWATVRPSGVPPMLRWWRSRYDASAKGERSRLRLRAAGVCPAPSLWREQKIAVAAALAALLLLAGCTPLTAGGLGWSMARAVAWTRWRIAARRHDAALVGAAPDLARCLAAELSMQRSLGDAIVCAAESCGANDPTLAAMLSNASSRVRLGERAGLALRRGVDDVAGKPLLAAHPLNQLLEVAVSDSAHRALGTAVLRFAQRIDEDARASAEVAATMSEPRFVAFAVPALTVLLAFVLANANPQSLNVLGSGLGVGTAIACIACAGGGAFAVMRLTSL